MTNCIVVTGSSSGIGEACACLFADKGYTVIGLDLVPSRSKKVQSRILDLADPIQISSFASDLELKGFSVTALIHCAAVQVEKDILTTEINDWELVLNINLRAAWLLAKYIVPLMKKGSSIINLSSVHAKATSPKMAAYAASKGGLSALTRAMAIELGEKGIRVNAINPGAIDTPMLRKGLSRYSDQDVALKKLANSSPLKKIGYPAEVAQLAYFLSQDELSGNITGQEFFCDSGVMSRLPSE
jgi:glucose 1-dehydrogenase